MANWFYFDSTGNKLGPVDSATLKLLAQHGAITPETPIETEFGKQAKASDIKGLAFAPAAPPSSVSVPLVAAPTTAPMAPVSPVSVSPGPTFRSGPIVVLDGNGCQLEVYDGKVVIIRKPGCSVFFLHGLKGDKTLYFSKMTGLQFKKNMYLQFTVPGGIESTGGLGSAVTDENTVLFGPKQNDLAKAIHDFIEDRIMGNSTPPEQFFAGLGNHAESPNSKKGSNPLASLFFYSALVLLALVCLSITMILFEAAPIVASIILLVLLSLGGIWGFRISQNQESRKKYRTLLKENFERYKPNSTAKYAKLGCFGYVLVFILAIFMATVLPEPQSMKNERLQKEEAQRQEREAEMQERIRLSEIEGEKRNRDEKLKYEPVALVTVTVETTKKVGLDINNIPEVVSKKARYNFEKDEWNIELKLNYKSDSGDLNYLCLFVEAVFKRGATAEENKIIHWKAVKAKDITSLRLDRRSFQESNILKDYDTNNGMFKMEDGEMIHTESY